MDITLIFSYTKYFHLIIVFQGNLRVHDERFDIIKRIKEDFSEKGTFKQRLEAAGVGQMMNGGWSVLCRRTACEKALTERSLGEFQRLKCHCGRQGRAKSSGPCGQW